jgi:glutaredoxin 3
MNDVVIYTKEHCPYCRQAERFFTQQGVPFENIDVSDDQPMREKLVELSGQMTVPQIFIGGRSIGGYSDLMALHTRGALAPLLAAGEPGPAP